MYTYAFFRTPLLPLNLLPGITGDVTVVGNRQLSALVEPALDLDSVQQNDTQLVQAVLTHDRIICDLFWQTPILPLQFGTWFISLDSLLAHLSAHQTGYLEKLTQFAGKAEYTLKVVPQEFSTESLSAEFPGKAYILAKKHRDERQLAQRTRQLEQFHHLLAMITQTYPQHLHLPPQTEIEKIYLLIDRQQEAALYQQLHEWQTQAPLWELIISEALPPYHFV
jgi:Gas vesicle synthesis protein GvpL/GvpF